MLAQFTLLAVTLAMAWLLARRVLRPLSRLQSVAHAIQQDDLTARTGMQGTDEMGRLAHDLDAMADSLQTRAADLKASYPQVLHMAFW